MIFGNDRTELRRMYRNAWQKQQAGQPMTALESQIADVVGQHPEYHAALESDLEEDFTVENGQTNPFLHMGLHLGLREQVATDRPAGIRAVFSDIAAKIGDAHGAEHRMIEILAETLWEAQRQNAAPDESRYLARLRKISGR